MVASYFILFTRWLERKNREGDGWTERGGGKEDGLNRNLGQRTVGRWGGRRGRGREREIEYGKHPGKDAFNPWS